MILVLLGTQPLPFNRLITELITLDKIGVISNHKVIIQSGYTKVVYDKFKVFEFIESKTLDELIEQATIVISHGGAGSIFQALEKRKQVIALARKQSLGEHVDDHQFELVEELFQEQLIIGAPTLQESFKLLDKFEFSEYHSQQQKIINQVLGWINEN